MTAGGDGVLEPVPTRQYLLQGPDGQPYLSPVPGRFGGHRRGRRYGRLDCPAAARALARGGYVADRVFFADESTAIAAGYRPCAACLPSRYQSWKSAELPPVNHRVKRTSHLSVARIHGSETQDAPA